MIKINIGWIPFSFCSLLSGTLEKSWATLCVTSEWHWCSSCYDKDSHTTSVYISDVQDHTGLLKHLKVGRLLRPKEMCNFILILTQTTDINISRFTQSSVATSKKMHSQRENGQKRPTGYQEWGAGVGGGASRSAMYTFAKGLQHADAFTKIKFSCPGPCC